MCGKTPFLCTMTLNPLNYLRKQGEDNKSVSKCIHLVQKINF